jgi:hypothetical protein
MVANGDHLIVVMQFVLHRHAATKPTAGSASVVVHTFQKPVVCAIIERAKIVLFVHQQIVRVSTVRHIDFANLDHVDCGFAVCSVGHVQPLQASMTPMATMHTMVTMADRISLVFIRVSLIKNIAKQVSFDRGVKPVICW